MVRHCKRKKNIGKPLRDKKIETGSVNEKAKEWIFKLHRMTIPRIR